VADKVVAEYGLPSLITATAAKDCLQENGALMLEFSNGVDFIEHRGWVTPARQGKKRRWQPFAA
jgi:hypothetical protein